MSVKAKVALGVAMLLGAAAPALASVAAPTEPYGTPAEQQQCVSQLEASLHGRSILGSRNGPGYIQDLGNLESMGLTEYDVMVGRCMEKLYKEYRHAHQMR